MRNTARIGVLTVLGCVSVGTVRAVDEPQEAPRLVVMLVVDQLRADLLDRYDEAFTGGFVRLREEGYRFTGASHNHAYTYTAAGHATLSTGVYPSRSGIVANSWRQRTDEGWTVLEAVEDPDSPLLGITGLKGRSPRNLLRSGLADWVLAADPDARVASVSLKDRAAITLAGQSKSEVYWSVKELGVFATSEYYRTDYPNWIGWFNRDVMTRIMADSVWDEDTPERLRALARADEAPYEFDGVHTVFPHVASAEVAPEEDPAMADIAFNLWALETQPRGDVAVELIAEQAVRELDLGQRDAVDFLAVSFSAVDYVGHKFGPFSREQLDNLLRLDKLLGDLFGFLDDEVGERRWLVGFSADHGVQTMPEYLESKGVPARRYTFAEGQALVRPVLQEVASTGVRGDSLADALAEGVEATGFVADAYTHSELLAAEPADSFAVLFRNSYHRDRAVGWLSRYGVEMRLPENHLSHEEPHGTTHGTPYWYDRHVPLILMGAGVEPGWSEAGVYTVDLAPTLAALAGIPAPDDLDGEVIYR